MPGIEIAIQGVASMVDIDPHAVWILLNVR